MRVTLPDLRIVLALLGASLAASGCYRSHTRSVDAGPAPVDIGVDAPAPRSCGVDDVHIDTMFWSAERGRPTIGTLLVADAAGREIVRQGADDSRVQACLRREEGPFQVGFLTSSGSVYFNGLDRDFRQDVWGTMDATTRQFAEVDVGRFGAPLGHQFVVQVTTSRVRVFDASPFNFGCAWPRLGTRGHNNCELRYLEEDATGRLVGGGETEFIRYIDPEAVLTTTTRTMTQVAFEIELPTEGLLVGLPITQVRPLACDESISETFAPGLPIFLRCRLSGAIRSLERGPDGVVRGQVDALVDEPFGTDAIMAILDDGDVEAIEVRPCCAEDPVRFRFPLARSITVEGNTYPEFRFSVDAPGYEHAFGYRGDDEVLYDLDPDGTIDGGLIPPAVSPRSSSDLPMPDAWAGAVTVEGTVPWLAPAVLPARGTHRVSMVRRRHRMVGVTDHTFGE